jgi:polysaccharide pyruvyl transferase WcaK-like protein
VRRYYARRGTAGRDTGAASRPMASGDLRAALKRLPVVRPAVLALRGLTKFVLSTVLGELTFAWRTYRFLRCVDVVLIAGSGQFNDEWFGPWAFPYTLARWAALARLAGARLAIVSVGAGPIHAPLSATFFKICLGLAEYRSFRDEFSRALMQRFGYRGECHVYPDLAHGLGRPNLERPARNPKERLRVGINAMPVKDERYWHSVDPVVTARYREALKKVAHTLLAEGCDVFFFPTQPKDMEVINDIVAALESDGVGRPRSDLIHSVDTVAGALQFMTSLDVVIATRFHGAVLPVALCTPTVAIVYNPKTHEAMRQMEAAEWTVDFESVDPATVLAKVRALLADPAGERKKLARLGLKQRQALDEQYDRLIHQLTGRPSAPSDEPRHGSTARHSSLESVR